MEIQNCIWTKQCAADSLSGHWKVWKDSKSKSSDPPWSAKQGFLQLWQKVVDKCKLSSLSLTTVIILIDTPYQKFDHCLLLVDDSIKMTMMTTTMILLVQKAARREMSCLAMMTSPGLWENTTSAHHRILSPKWLLCSQRCVADLWWGCWWKQYRSHSSGAQITSRLQSRSWPKWPPWPTWTSCQSKLKLKSGKI